MSAISEQRRKAWQTLIKSTDMAKNSKKAWPTIRKLCDDPCKPKQHYNNTANQVAHQLLLNGRVPKRHPKVRLDRQRYPEDPGFMRAFTAAELDIGIRVLKNGKAPGLDDIQTELIKQFGPKARDWLLRFFNNCTETKKIPKIWRQAKVVALLKPGKDPSVAKPATEPGGAHRKWLREAPDHRCCLRGLVCCLRYCQPPTPPQQGARDDRRHTPDRPDRHLPGKHVDVRFFVVLNGKKSRWRR